MASQDAADYPGSAENPPGTPIDRSERVRRRSFLRYGSAGMAGTAALLAFPRPSGVLARENVVATASRTRSGSALRAEVTRAAREYGIPAAVLLAMGYVNTRLEMPPPEASQHRNGDPEGPGAYGIMALARNSSSDTLGAAATLTGMPARRLQTDRAANLRGGAALLADSQGREQPDDPLRWIGAIHGSGGKGPRYAATSGIGAGELYAGQVEDILRNGFSVRTSSGERVALEARRRR